MSLFRHSVQGLRNFDGGTERTFSGLKFALESSPWHTFVCVFTDELGDDTDEVAAREEVKRFKEATHSEIFFMIVPGAATRGRGGAPIKTFVDQLGDIGQVIDLKNVTNNGVGEVVEKMLDTVICQDNAYGFVFLYIVIFILAAVAILGTFKTTT